MTHIVAIIAALAIAASSVSQAAPILPGTTSSAQCEILTPQRPLLEGRPYEVHIKNCRGRGDVQLRFGSPTNLSTDETPACKNVDFTTERCIFTPSRAGERFAFSTIDNSKNEETFSAPFRVLPKSAVAPAITAGDTPSQDKASTPAPASTQKQTGAPAPVKEEPKPASADKSAMPAAAPALKN